MYEQRILHAKEAYLEESDQSRAMAIYAHYNMILQEANRHTFANVLDARFSSPSLLQFWLSSNPSSFKENPEQRKKKTRSLNVEKANRTQNITKKQNQKTSEKPNLGSVSLAGGDGAGEGRLETHRERERES